MKNNSELYDKFPVAYIALLTLVIPVYNVEAQ